MSWTKQSAHVESMEHGLATPSRCMRLPVVRGLREWGLSVVDGLERGLV
jgi:hypothetical protein